MAVPSSEPPSSKSAGRNIAEANSNLTLRRGLDILEFLASAGAPRTVEAIKSGTGIPASSAYRILHSLV